MIRLTANTRVFLASAPVDFRKQIDGLVALCQRHLQHDPRSGALYVFINRARTMIRILHYDGSGYWLATKRLSQGTYADWPTVAAEVSVLEAARLRPLMKMGIENSNKIN